MGRRFASYLRYELTQKYAATFQSLQAGNEPS
jgi:hypothetical protein